MTTSSHEPTAGFGAARALFDELCDLDRDAREARLAGVAPELAALVRELLAEDETPQPGLESPPLARRAAERARHERLPERIGRFRVLERVGRGGMGVVYKARQDSPDRLVAVKVVRSAAVTGAALRRFQVEAQVLGWLDHPGIARIYEAGTADTGHGEEPWFAMELVDGLPITRHARERELGVRARLELLAKVCDAVQHAHQKGVIHRDLKPGNVLVDARGEPKVLDFGMARATDAAEVLSSLHTHTGELLGTLPYMSPEQLGGDPRAVDTRADVYALGVLGYELLSGVLPHDLVGRAVHEAARVVTEDEPTSLGVRDRGLRGDVETIVGKAMAKDADRRYGSAEELASDLRRFLRDEPIVARRPTAWYQLRKFARRNRVLVAGVAAVAAALVTGAIVGTVLYLEKERERHDAVEARALALRARDEEVLARRAAEVAREAERAARRDEAAARVRAEDALALREELMARFVEILQAPTPWGDGMDVRLVDVLDRAAGRSRSAFVGHPATRARLLSAIGTTYGALGLYDRALPLLEESARLTEERGAGPVAVALARSAVGYHRAKSGDPGGIEAMEAALATLERKDAPREELVRHRGRLAEALLGRGRIAESEAHARRAIELAGDVDDPALDSPRFIAWKALGDGLMRAGRRSEALEVLTRALELARELPGRGADEVLTKNSIAVLHADRSDVDEAVRLMHEVLDGMRELGGERHEFYAIQLSNLAAMEGLVGNDERALTLFEESLALTRSLSPSPSRNEAVALGNLSDLLRRLGRIEEAVELGRQGAEMLSRTFGEESDRHANGRAILGRALMELERYGEAAEELERAVEVRRVSAPDHPSQGENAAMLAEARLALGEWDVAAEAARFAADALARSPSGSAHWVLVARVTEALALALAGDLEAGLPAAEAALDRAPPAPAGDRALAEAALGLVVVLAGGTDAGWERFDAATPDFASGDARTRRIRALAAIVEERAGR